MTPSDLRRLGDGYNVTPDMTFNRQIRLACRQAADEIERLNTENETLRSHIDAPTHTTLEVHAENLRLRAENETLRASLIGTGWCP